MRLHSMNGRARRGLFRLGRVLIAPFHVAICVSAAVVMMPHRHRQATVSYLLRAARIVGIARESLTWRRSP